MGRVALLIAILLVSSLVIEARKLDVVEDLGHELECVCAAVVRTDGHGREDDVLDRVVGRLHSDQHRVRFPL